jgi:arylsulfatase A-like enzyme
MPGWIEEKDNYVSESGSMYGYDTHVPLIFYGDGIASQRIKRRVDMTSVAPTTAHLMQISEPTASEGEVLEEIVGSEKL